MARSRRWFVAAATALAVAYITGPFVEDGVYLTRPYVRLVSWSDGLEGFGLCRDIRSGGYHVGRACE